MGEVGIPWPFLKNNNTGPPVRRDGGTSSHHHPQTTGSLQRQACCCWTPQLLRGDGVTTKLLHYYQWTFINLSRRVEKGKGRGPVQSNNMDCAMRRCRRPRARTDRCCRCVSEISDVLMKGIDGAIRAIPFVIDGPWPCRTLIGPRGFFFPCQGGTCVAAYTRSTYRGKKESFRRLLLRGPPFWEIEQAVLFDWSF